MPPQQQGDWFAQNAPPAGGSGGDWFAQNSPAASQPQSWLSRVFSPRQVPQAPPGTKYPVPGSFEGHPENIGEYVPATAGRVAEGAVDISRGNVAMGTHKIVQGGMNALAPALPLVAAGAPLATATGLIGGTIGQQGTQAVGSAVGLTPDQAAVAGDIGGIAGGYGGGKFGDALGDTLSTNLRTATPHELLASAMTKKIGNVPADAELAMPILHQSAADLGVNTEKITPQVYKKIAANAGSIIDDRVNSVADPVRHEVIPAEQVSANGDNAQLMARLGEKPVTVDRLQNALKVMNKELRRANYYALDPSAQHASGLADVAAAASQGRNVFYDYLGDRTGVDVQPLRQQQASLMRLQDMGAKTADTVANRTASYTASSRIARGIKAAGSVVKFRPDQFPSDPTAVFVGKMSKVFEGVNPAAAMRDLGATASPLPQPSAPPSYPYQNSLPPGQYNAPASTARPQGMLPSGSPGTGSFVNAGPIDPEYLPPQPSPPPNVRGQLPAGQYNQPGGFEPNQPALPPRSSTPLPAQNARPPVSRDSVGTQAAINQIMEMAKNGEISIGEANRRISNMGQSVKVQRPTAPPR